MLCISQDHSLSADVVHLVFLEISEFLDWSAMICISFVGIPFCFCSTVYATVLNSLARLQFRNYSVPRLFTFSDI